MSIRVVSNKLKPAASEEEFKLHCAALEWSLAEPIIINSARDIKSSVDWKDRLEPFHHHGDRIKLLSEHELLKEICVPSRSFSLAL